MLEDHVVNTVDPADHDHSNPDHDLLGELYLLDDLSNIGLDPRWGGGTQPHPYTVNIPVGDPSPSPYWRRELGEGVGGFGGSQSVFGEEIGFQMEGQFVDMYFKIEHIGNPNTVCMYWSTDQENNNLDQAPHQDRPTSDVCFDLEVKGSITINKHIEPASDADASFAFGGDLGAFNLDVIDGAPASVIFGGLSAGAYDVFEDLGNLPEGWLLGSIVCDDPSQDSTVDLATGFASIDLSAGEEVVCTYINVEQPVEGGTIVIVKHSLPHSETLFDFTSNIPGFEQFSLSDTGDQHTLTMPDLEPGQYNVTESAMPAQWHLDSLMCLDPDQGSSVDGMIASIDLDSGEVVTCTFTNGMSATITIGKQTLPDGSPDVFGFSGDLGDFSLSDGQTKEFASLDPHAEDEYVVTEDSLPPGWKLEQIDCIDPTGGSSMDLVTASATLNIEHGDQMFCTFHNQAPADFTIVKQVLGVPDGEFCFLYSGPDEDGEVCIQTSGGTGQESYEELLAGLWSIVEVIDGPYAVLSMDCDNGDTADAVNLEPGDDVTCTFVNIPTIPIPVNNPLALFLLILMLMATGWYFRPAAMRKF